MRSFGRERSDCKQWCVPGASRSALSITPSTVRVLINGELAAISSTYATYHYYPESRVRLMSAEPSGGPTDGGTVVLVRLTSPDHLPALVEEDHNDGVICHFGTASVPGTRLLPESGALPPAVHFTVRCVSPPVEAMTRQTERIHRNDSNEVGLTVTLNGQDALRRPALRWLYYPQHRVSLSYTTPIGGPISGGTRVRIFGSLLRNAAGMHRSVQCRFGETVVVEASLASFDEVRCLSPDLSLIYPQLNTSTLMNASLLPMGPPPSTPPPPMPPASPPPNTTNITTLSLIHI